MTQGVVDLSCCSQMIYFIVALSPRILSLLCIGFDRICELSNVRQIVAYSPKCIELDIISEYICSSLCNDDLVLLSVHLKDI